MVTSDEHRSFMTEELKYVTPIRAGAFLSWYELIWELRSFNLINVESGCGNSCLLGAADLSIML